MGFMRLKIKIKEKLKLKTKLTRQKFKNQFHTSHAESFQLPNAVKSFQIHLLALEIYQLDQEIVFHFAIKGKQKNSLLS